MQQQFWYEERSLAPEYIFLHRKHVFAMVHWQPVTLGHVLICPMKKNIKSICKLSELETLELFVCAREVISKFEDHFKVKTF